MIKSLLILICASALVACSRQQKDFSTVKVGMTKEEVISTVGEPEKKNNIGIELWVYPRADRTVVFRSDTVYGIITTAKARMDSIRNSLEKLGKQVENKLENAGKSIDSTADSIQNKLRKDP